MYVYMAFSLMVGILSELRMPHNLLKAEAIKVGPPAPPTTR